LQVHADFKGLLANGMFGDAKINQDKTLAG
jgi:hypothetical protein